jgi:hypothetical protein
MGWDTAMERNVRPYPPIIPLEVPVLDTEAPICDTGASTDIRSTACGVLDPNVDATGGTHRILEPRDESSSDTASDTSSSSTWRDAYPDVDTPDWLWDGPEHNAHVDWPDVVNIHGDELAQAAEWYDYGAAEWYDYVNADDRFEPHFERLPNAEPIDPECVSAC